jgi:hypothetical protein
VFLAQKEASFDGARCYGTIRLDSGYFFVFGPLDVSSLLPDTLTLSTPPSYRETVPRGQTSG